MNAGAPGGRGDDEEALVEKALRIVRNRKWVILQALIIIPAIVLAVSLVQDKKYTASASLLFQQSDGGSGPIDLSRQAVTNEELLDLPVIAQRTARLLGGRADAAAVEASVDFESTTDSDLVAITATTTSPRLSADMANRYGQAYVTFRSEADRADLQRRFEIYEESYRSLPPEDRAGARGRQLLDRLDRLRISQALREGNATRTADVVQRATVPTSASSPKVARNLALAVIFALALGLGLASLLERLDRAVGSVDELESIYAMPVLARIPRLKRSRRTPGGDPRSTQEAEAFRMLRANLRYFNVDSDRELKSILVASPMAADGKSTVAAGLAMTMASMGDRVVLVEADMHKQHSSDAFREPSDFGLSTVLSGQVSLDEALIETPLSLGEDSSGGRSLIVLRSGPVPPNPSELMESERMRQVILELEERYGTVIIDSPPLSQVSDALTLVPDTSGVILVSRLRHTMRDAAVQTRNQLLLLNAHTLGVVANFSAAKSGSYYGD